MLLGIGLAVVVAVVITVGVIAAHVVRVAPGQVAVLVGRTHRRDGRQVGYRVVTGGAVLRYPIVEQVEWMSTAPIPMTAAVRHAYTRGGEPVDVAMRGRVAIAPALPALDHAIERFLGRPPEEIARVARETVEGAARGVLAGLTRAEADADAARLAVAIAEAAEGDLRRLGLVVDGLAVVPSSAGDHDRLAEALRGAGLVDAIVTTELSCDVAAGRAPAVARVDDAGGITVDGALPVLAPDLLVDAGPGELVCRDGRASYRWTTAPVRLEQLVAAARLLAEVRAAGGAYR